MCGSPASKTRTSKQLMRFPPGLKGGGGGWVQQVMKSTCLEHEEVRRGDRKGQRGEGRCPPLASKNPASWWNVHSASLSNCRSWHVQIQGDPGHSGGGGFGAYRCPTLAPEQGFSYIPAPKILQRFHK